MRKPTVSFLGLTLPLVLVAALAGGCGGSDLHDAASDHLTDHVGEAGDWSDVTEDLPGDVGAATAELAETATELAKSLTEIPPPGKVELKDLSPELASYQGKQGQDFLTNAKDHAGKALSFQYVKVGVPEFDEFFRQAEEAYALAYQAKQVIANMKHLSSKLLKTKVDPGPAMKEHVQKAMTSVGPPPALAELRALEAQAKTLQDLLAKMPDRLGKLAAAGEALVKATPASVTNPKVLANIGKVKEGVSHGLHLVKATGNLGVSLAGDLSSWKS